MNQAARIAAPCFEGSAADLEKSVGSNLVGDGVRFNAAAGALKETVESAQLETPCFSVVRWVGLEPTASAEGFDAPTPIRPACHDALTTDSSLSTHETLAAAPHRVNRKALFAAFNCAKAYARQGYLDGARLNRALGVSQRRRPSDYTTTIEDCTCPDRRYRHVVCKHMLSCLLNEAAR